MRKIKWAKVKENWVQLVVVSSLLAVIASFVGIVIFDEHKWIFVMMIVGVLLVLAGLYRTLTDLWEVLTE